MTDGAGLFFVGMPLKMAGAVGTGYFYTEGHLLAVAVSAFVLGVGLTAALIGMWGLEQ